MHDQLQHPSVTTPRPARGPSRTAPWGRAIAIGTVATALANLIILIVGRAGAASFTYLDGGVASQVTTGGVVLMSTVPLLVGTVAAALLARRWPWVIRTAQVVGAGLALATVAGPLTIETDGGTRLALAAMHVVVAVAVVTVLEAGRRAGSRRGSGSPRGRAHP